MEKARKLGGLHEVIAGNVRRLRKAKDLSQEELADICGYHGERIGGAPDWTSMSAGCFRG